MKYIVNPKYTKAADYCYCGTNTTSCNDYDTCSHVEIEVPIPPAGGK